MAYLDQRELGCFNHSRTNPLLACGRPKIVEVKNMPRFFAVIACLSFVTNISAAPPEKLPPCVIKAARLLDVKNGQYLLNAGILVEAGKIKVVGPLADVQKLAPEMTNVIDLGAATVLPGLIDCHTHLTVDP